MEAEIVIAIWFLIGVAFGALCMALWYELEK